LSVEQRDAVFAQSYPIREISGRTPLQSDCEFIAVCSGVWDKDHIEALVNGLGSADVAYSRWRFPSADDGALVEWPYSPWSPVHYTSGIDFVGPDVLVRRAALVRALADGDLAGGSADAPQGGPEGYTSMPLALQRMATVGCKFHAVPQVTYTREGADASTAVG